MKPIATDMYSFERLRKDGYIYVDKTERWNVSKMTRAMVLVCLQNRKRCNNEKVGGSQYDTAFAGVGLFG